MSRLKLLTAKELEKLLLQLGFVRQRQRGSHVFYQHFDGRTTVLPFHTGKTLTRQTICLVLREIELSVDDYNELIK